MAPPFLGLVLAGLASVPLSGEDLLIEAESFADTGGWVLDTQSVASMGSPYLLAHGLGIPLADARTTIVFPQAGSYRLWIRTRDWVPDHPDAPGRFQVLLDGEPVPVEFGTVAGDWNWQDGGMVTVAAGSVEIALRDLTGFDGRCDALAFLSDPDTPPPNEPVALEAWRRQMLGESSEPPVVDSYDLVVVGGGLAGCCAAIAAAREGLTVALIQDRPFLGGNASQEIRVPTQGMVRHPIVESVRNSGPHRDPVMIEHDAHRLAVVTAETNITVFLNWRAFAANTDEEGRIFSVDARQTGTGETRRFPASWFVDSTGDGWIGYWAGADFRMGREARDEFEESRAPLVADAQTMGSSIMWNAVDTGSPASFPAVPWAMAVAGSADAVEGGWNWEYGLLLDTIYDAEAIRDHLLRAIYGNFANARKRSQYANYALAWVPYVTGKRESRRLLGDHILTENDVREGVFFEDAVGMGSWPIDVHEPTAVDYRSVALNTAVAPYFFPFRSLYSRNVPNLMMAGRCLSATHVGLGSPRVMHTCGQMGVAVGYAASLCQRYGVDPREIYRDPDKTLELQLLIGGDWPDRPPPLVAIVDNVAGTGQRVVLTGDWTSSTSVSGFHGTDYLHD
ncbi:MAG: FAD-dependent oxidoreductase, partial [Verrucomicrobiae bacterium]|nr:FAD-dependent oxidoreductase [Verrucomicrobiae bacterium]